MKLIRDFDNLPDSAKGATIALGNFDGVHLGHQAILKACLDAGGKPAVMTFAPHPREFFSNAHEPLRVYPLKRKLQLLEQAGIETVFLARFNRALASTSAQGFVDLLHQKLGAKHIVTGYNFAFGKGRGGDTEFLAQAAAACGMGFTRVAPVTLEGRPISSSAIRACLKEGNMAEASALLGRAYSISGRVHAGDKRGRALGFPTANIRLGKLFTPRFGIYAARVRLGGIVHDAVASLGIRPMYPVKEPLLEVHCFGVNRTFYGEEIDVQPIEFLREEMTFPDEKTLSAHIENDCRRAKEVLAHAS